MKTVLSEADRDRVWRAVEPSWLHYAWRDGHWQTFPVDPRKSPGVMSYLASGQREGMLTRASGFIEAT